MTVSRREPHPWLQLSDSTTPVSSLNYDCGMIPCRIILRLQRKAGRESRATTRLTQARIAALRPRMTTLDIGDACLKGFGVRDHPTGRKCCFIRTQAEGKRIWKVVGDAGRILWTCSDCSTKAPVRSGRRWGVSATRQEQEARDIRGQPGLLRQEALVSGTADGQHHVRRCQGVVCLASCDSGCCRLFVTGSLRHHDLRGG